MLIEEGSNNTHKWIALMLYCAFLAIKILSVLQYLAGNVV